MTYEQFQILVSRLERVAQRNPTKYKLQVGLLALGGYGYILLILLALVASIILLFTVMTSTGQANYFMIKFLFLLFIPVAVTFKSLWDTLTLRFPPPSGLLLTREEVPQLFDLIDKLKKALDCPPFNYVKLTSDFNAAVVQVPRLGLLGWNENYLIIGLPLLQALSLEQFEAVLAHEFGHLSGNHSRFKGWVYQVRQTWLLLLEKMKGNQQEGGFWLYSVFFNWYIPFFNAYSFVLARADEYEADRCAVQLTGKIATAGALINVSVKSQWIDREFWQEIYEQVKAQPEPPGQPFHQLGQVLQENLELTRAREWLESSLNIKTDFADTHPCLRDRLNALGVDPQTAPILLKPVVESAAALLGENLHPLTQQLNLQWQTAVRFQWKEKHNQFQTDQLRLQILNCQAKSSGLSIDEAWEQARLTHYVESEAAAIPLLKALLETDSFHVGANYLLGEILLTQGEAGGRDYLERAMSKDPYIYINACQLICDFLSRQGKTEEVHLLRQKAEKHYGQVLQAQQERSHVSQSDRFLAHNLPPDRVKSIRRQLASYPEVKSAYLVRKVVNIFPEVPFYVLAIVPRVGAWEFNSREKDRRLVNHIAQNLQFSGEMWITILPETQGSFLKTLQRIEDSNIY